MRVEDYLLMENEMNEKMMTMQEIADAVGVSYDTVNRCVKRCFSDKLEHGKRAYFNEAEVAIISKELKSNTYVSSQLTVEAGATVKNTTTELEVMTTAQVAEQLHTSSKVILENARKCLPNKHIENGKPTLWTQAEITVLLDWLKNHNGNHSSNLYFESKGALSTDLTPALKIKKAMELMQEGYEEELQILRAKNEAQKKQLIEQQPKVDTYNRIANSTGLKTMQEAAKLLGIGSNTLFSVLRDKRIFYRSNGVNLPAEIYIKRGLFEVKEEPYKKDGKDFVYTRVFATAKGLLWLEKQIVAKRFEVDFEKWASPKIAEYEKQLARDFMRMTI